MRRKIPPQRLGRIYQRLATSTAVTSLAAALSAQIRGRSTPGRASTT